MFVGFITSLSNSRLAWAVVRSAGATALIDNNVVYRFWLVDSDDSMKSSRSLFV